MALIIKPNYRPRALQPGLLLSIFQNFKRNNQIYQQKMMQSAEYNGLRADRAQRFERLKGYQKERNKTEEMKNKIKEREEALAEVDKRIHMLQFEAFHTDFFINVNNAIYSFWFKLLQGMMPPMLHQGMGFQPSVSSSSSSSSAPEAPRVTTFSDIMASLGPHTRQGLPTDDEPPVHGMQGRGMSQAGMSQAGMSQAGGRGMSQAGMSQAGGRGMSQAGGRGMLMRTGMSHPHESRAEATETLYEGSANFPPTLHELLPHTLEKVRGKPSMGRINAGDASPPPSRIPRKPSPNSNPRLLEFMEDLFPRDWHITYYLLPEPDEMHAKQWYLKMLLKTFEFSDAGTCTGAAAMAELLQNEMMIDFLKFKCSNGPVARSNASLFKTVTNAIWNDYIKMAEYLAIKGIRVISPKLFNDEDSD